MTSPWHPFADGQFLTLALVSGDSLVVSPVDWPDSVRIIGSEYANASLFDQVSSSAEFEDLAALADLTNPAIRAAAGSVELVRMEDRLYGPGAGLIMSAFSWPGRSTRFSNGSYGVYYAARTIETAVAETVHHLIRFLAGMPTQMVEKTVLHAYVRGNLVDVRRPHPSPPDVYHPVNYGAAQQFGAIVRTLNAYGLVYHSVRDNPNGECAAIFRPPALSPARAVQTLEYHWDGQRVAVQ